MIKNILIFTKEYIRQIRWLIMAAIFINIGSIFFLPYLLNAILYHSISSVLEIMLVMLFMIAGFITIFIFLFEMRKRIAGDNQNKNFVFGIIVLLIGTIIISQIISVLTGLFGVMLYSNFPYRFDYIKTIIDLFAAILSSLATPVILWCFAAHLYSKTFKEGISNSFKTLKYGYKCIIGITIVNAAILYLAEMTGDSLAAMIFKCIVSILTSILLIVWTIYHFYVKHEGNENEK